MKDFPLEKILSCSASDYVASVGKELKDYKLIGIHGYPNFGDAPSFKVFQKAIPKDAEIVVDYVAGEDYFAGVALVPQPKAEK